MFTFLKSLINRFRNKSQDIQATIAEGRVPAIPYDTNGRNTLVPMVAIVDIDGKITGYLPLAAEDNGDGTASIKITN